MSPLRGETAADPLAGLGAAPWQLIATCRIMFLVPGSPFAVRRIGLGRWFAGQDYFLFRFLLPPLKFIASDASFATPAICMQVRRST